MFLCRIRSVDTGDFLMVWRQNNCGSNPRESALHKYVAVQLCTSSIVKKVHRGGLSNLLVCLDKTGEMAR